MSKIKEVEDGTKRISSTDLNICIKNGSSWDLLKPIPESLRKIIGYYTESNTFETLIDPNDEQLLKGSLTPLNKISGARIKILPSGEQLARAGFSLFAKNLRFNFDAKHDWSVCYENASGLKTYLYTVDKIHLEQERKFQLVRRFEKDYAEIVSHIQENLDKIEYLALYTLLKTFIRVGNYEYYLKDSHKGLTTLQKKDITISDNKVLFDFIGKDGVPQFIEKEFHPDYIALLERHLLNKGSDDFVFSDKNGVPLHSERFSRILFKITGEHFYPHIIRSHYADSRCLQYIESESADQDCEDVFLEIAKNLGHKKYNKRGGVWEISYSVTIKNYIYPKYVARMRGLS